jgi:uncharacterized protein YciI
MLIVSVSYTKPLEQIDALLEKHIEFLKVQYGKKVFFASGRKVPRTGGIILAKADNPKELNAILQQDPFYKNGVAEYEITEFVPSMTLPEFADLKEL